MRHVLLLEKNDVHSFFFFELWHVLKRWLGWSFSAPEATVRFLLLLGVVVTGMVVAVFFAIFYRREKSTVTCC